jgi:putative Mn2+ efflux pump MntP
MGLAMDAFAVSVVSGCAYKQLHVKHALRMAAFFGGFQAFMPLIGSLAGLSLKEHIVTCDHWIAFGLLSAVGAKMIYESFKIKSVEESFDPSNISVLLALSVATSIDALAIGITLSLITRSISALSSARGSAISSRTRLKSSAA